MTIVTDDESLAVARSGRSGLLLTGAAVGLLVAAGLLLWWRHGDAVFSEYVLAALAWCF